MVQNMRKDINMRKGTTKNAHTQEQRATFYKKIIDLNLFVLLYLTM